MYNKIINVFAIVVIIFWETQTFVLSNSKINIELTNIIDGDTIEAKIDNNKFVIRLEGIDCFETTKINRAYKQAYNRNLSINEVIEKGLYSKTYLENLYINSNKKVFFEFKGLDKYSRVLGIIYIDKINVNNALIKNGGCIPYTYK